MDKIDSIIEQAVFAADAASRAESRNAIFEAARSQDARPASIQALYEAAGKGLYKGLTVPAINIRGIAYEVARAVFRAAMKSHTGAFIFEIARSEIGYTLQNPDEYAAAVLAAAVKEGFHGPVFIQGDHYQVKNKVYRDNAAAEMGDMRELIRQSIEAGFYNIDIDASTLVDLAKPTLEEQQEANSSVTAEMTNFIRSIEPEGVTVSVGGEIGEIGKGNSTAEDMKAFMDGYRKRLGKGVKGISKISIQTGTAHGGVVLPDGSIADVKLDFKTLEKLSEIARREYGMGGAVQHGASTLPDEAFDMFPKVGTVEVHLATGFQNVIYDSRHFPGDLRQGIYKELAVKYSDERKEGETEEQFVYKTRKKAFGDFKKDLWNLPESTLRPIMGELEDRFAMLFKKLNVEDTVELVKKHVG